jgi:hypothetical protein
MTMRNWLQSFLAGLPAEQRARLRRITRPARMGSLRRTQPLSQRYGFDRGQPVDRYYIETFLSASAGDVRGRGLEIKTSAYLRRYDSGLTRCDVLDIDTINPEATVVADLSAAVNVPEELFDVFILTQTLHNIYDIHSAVWHSHRILRRGGVLLATIPTVSRVDRNLQETDFWRMTPVACARLFGDVFGPENVTITSYGNVLSATAFLMGIAAEELRREELDERDPFFPVLVAIRAERV